MSTDREQWVKALAERIQARCNFTHSERAVRAAEEAADWAAQLAELYALRLRELLTEWLGTPFFETEREWQAWVEEFRPRVVEASDAPIPWLDSLLIEALMGALASYTPSTRASALRKLLSPPAMERIGKYAMAYFNVQSLPEKGAE
jgi:hypothetical protein